MAGKREVLLTDSSGNRPKPFIHEVPTTRHGERPCANDRACIEDILWVLLSGARWTDLLDCYPSLSTCWRRLAKWEEAAFFDERWRASNNELDEEGRITGRKSS